MKRRSFLVGAGALALGQLLTGCSRAKQFALRVEFLKHSVPFQLIRQFRQQLDSASSTRFIPVSQLAPLFELLQTLQYQATQATPSARFPIPLTAAKKTPVPDLVTLGDSWLTKAIQQDLIQPLELESLDRWQQLPERWRMLVRRDRSGALNPQGQIWAAPYRWGSTIIAYRKDKFKVLGWEPRDWSDLWRPALHRRFSLLNQPREVIGLTLKKLGYSYNERDLARIPALETELQTLQQNVKFYSSKTYLQPLILGDTWLAVGWSNDILPLLQRHNHLAAVIPESGTALWSDLWVRPATHAVADNSHRTTWKQWAEFCWQPDIVQKLSTLSHASSPLLTSAAGLPKASRNVLFPEPSLFDRSEFLETLPQVTIDQYRSLWLKIRQGDS